MKKRTVIHLLASDRFSGAENVVCQIINGLNNRNSFKGYYCSPDGQIRESLISQCIPYIPISKLSIHEIRRLKKEYRPDLIHTHDIRASVFASLVFRDIPIVATIHNNFVDSRKLNIKTLLFMLCSSRISHIYWVSESALADFYFRKLIRNKSSILKNVMDRKYIVRKCEEDSEKYKYDLVYVGRLTQQKNPKMLISVMKYIVEKSNNVSMAIIGTGNLFDETKRLILNCGLKDNVHMLGFIENPYKILASSKVMLMTSLWEGTPMCIIESMTLGVPVVSTPVDGITELIEPEVTGYLENSVEELGERCIKLIEDSDLQKTFSTNCLEFSRRYNDIKTYIDIIEKEYSELIG